MHVFFNEHDASSYEDGIEEIAKCFQIFGISENYDTIPK
jgi:hypothetical protein